MFQIALDLRDIIETELSLTKTSEPLSTEIAIRQTTGEELDDKKKF